MSLDTIEEMLAAAKAIEKKGYDKGFIDGRAYADEALIAAAPELLDALEKLLTLNESNCGVDIYAAHMDYCEQLISKAKGEV